MAHTETGQLDWVINGYQAAPLDFSFDLKETQPPSTIPEAPALARPVRKRRVFPVLKSVETCRRLAAV